MSMDRRRFIRLTAAGTVLGLIGAERELGALPVRNEFDLASPDLITILGVERVRDIGARYRLAHPEEDGASTLRAAILEMHAQLSRGHWGGPLPIAQLVRADFADERTIVVDGWLLSLTEARQCALHSLLPA